MNFLCIAWYLFPGEKYFAHLKIEEYCQAYMWIIGIEHWRTFSRVFSSSCWPTSPRLSPIEELLQVFAICRLNSFTAALLHLHFLPTCLASQLFSSCLQTVEFWVGGKPKSFPFSSSGLVSAICCHKSVARFWNNSTFFFTRQICRLVWATNQGEKQ